MEAEPQKKNGLTLAEYYKDLFPKLLEYSSVDRVITEHNVFQTPNYKIRELVNGMCREVLLPGSGIKNFANAEAFLQQLKEGNGGMAAGKGDGKGAAFADGFFAGCGEDVGRAFRHGGGVLVDMNGKMDGAAATLHDCDLLI